MKKECLQFRGQTQRRSNISSAGGLVPRFVKELAQQLAIAVREYSPRMNIHPFAF
jgi:hypothetical protein